MQPGGSAWTGALALPRRAANMGKGTDNRPGRLGKLRPLWPFFRIAAGFSFQYKPRHAKLGTQTHAQGFRGGLPQPHFNIGAMRVKPFPMPPLAEQQEFVRRVEALFALADQIETRLHAAQTLVAKLAPSLLARAFRGQLVPQDPADEPAEKLLERIRRAAGCNA